MNKTVFYDRDGVILQMVYDLESGTIDVVRTIKEIQFVPGIISLLRHTTSLGYRNIIVSNQPGIGLRKITKEKFEDVHKEYMRQIEKQGGKIDRVYYCFHHTFARLDEFKLACDCRKPNIGLFTKAAKDFNLDLQQSWVIGDGVNDILSGEKIGAKTILLGNIYEAEYLRILEKQLSGVKPTHMIKKLIEAIDIIKG